MKKISGNRRKNSSRRSGFNRRWITTTYTGRERRNGADRRSGQERRHPNSKIVPFDKILPKSEEERQTQ